MPKTFSRTTLQKFEDASASIPIRQLVRAFERAGIRMGADPGGGEGGARRTQFRRYVAGVDQQEPRQLDRLSYALGALIAEVAASKEEYLITAAESDGFAFEDGVFTSLKTAPHSFAITRPEDFASIEDRARRLYALANDSPKNAVAGARELLASVCHTVVQRTGARAAVKKTTSLAEIAEAALEALEAPPVDIDQLAVVVDNIANMRNVSARDARLAVGAAAALAGWIAETYAQRVKGRRGL